MANVCQHLKYGFCKFLDKCKYKHVNENCNEKSCEINDCEKRHPMLCRYFKEFGRCKFGSFCYYRHSNYEELMIETMNNKLNSLEAIQTTLITRIDNLTPNSYVKSTDLESSNDQERRNVTEIKRRINCVETSNESLRLIITDLENKLNILANDLKALQDTSTINQLKLDMFNDTPRAALGDSSPESVSFSDIPQLDGANCMSEIQNPPVVNLENAEHLDFGLSREVMVKLDEYLWVDPSPTSQTLSNIACGLNISLVKVQKYVEWKNSQEMTSTMF